MSERAISDPTEHGWTEVDGKWMWGGSGGGSGSIQDGDTEGQITTWDGTEWTPEGAVVVDELGNVRMLGSDMWHRLSLGNIDDDSITRSRIMAPITNGNDLTIFYVSVVSDLEEKNLVFGGGTSVGEPANKLSFNTVSGYGETGGGTTRMSIDGDGNVNITGKLFINGEEVTAGGGGASYTAGNGITIDGDTIKMSGSYSGNLTATDFITT